MKCEKEEFIEGFFKLLKRETIEECEQYVIQAYTNFKLNDREFDYHMGIIVGFKMCYTDYKMIIDEYDFE